MAKIRMVIELEYDADMMYSDEPGGTEWFLGQVLGDDLELHSRHIGDFLGPVEVLELGPARP